MVSYHVLSDNIHVYEHLWRPALAKKHVVGTAPGTLATCQATHEAQEEEDVKSHIAAGSGARLRRVRRWWKNWCISDRKRQAVEKSDKFLLGFWNPKETLEHSISLDKKPLKGASRPQLLALFFRTRLKISIPRRLITSSPWDKKKTPHVDSLLDVHPRNSKWVINI